MTRQKIERLFQILQAEHENWEPGDDLATIWDEAVGALPLDMLERAAKRYLLSESGKPQLSKFLKFLPPGAAARVRGEETSTGSGQRTREETFAVILSDCTFDGARLWNPYKSFAWNVDGYLAWRREAWTSGGGVLVAPAHWNRPEHAPEMLLAFLDRFSGVGGIQGPAVSIEELPM